MKPTAANRLRAGEKVRRFSFAMAAAASLGVSLLSGCQSDRSEETSLVEREQLAFGYSNEIRRIEALRAQYEEQKETLEILFSEMDRQAELIAKYERDIAQATGRVAVLQAQLQAELEKEKADRAQIDALKQASEAAAAPPPAAPAPATPPAAETPPAGSDPPK